MAKKKPSGPSLADKLFEELDHKHPDYVAAQFDWSLYRDVMGEAEIKKEDYLPKGVQENKPIYDFRTQLAEFIPDCPLAVDKIVSALFREKPKRDLKDARLEAFCDDVDLEGTHLNTFMDRVARQILGYGTTRLFMNMRAVSAPIESRADELALDIRPYLILYGPLSVIDWDVDPYGGLLMVRIKETSWARDVAPRYHSQVTRFITYTVGGFEFVEFTERDGKQEVTDRGGGETTVGAVPMIVRHWKRQRDMVGVSYLRYSARADVGKFRAESDLAYDTYVHAHPTLKAKVERELAAIGIGSNTYLKLDPTSGEDVEYLQPPTSAFEALLRVIDDKRASVYRHAGIDPLGVISAGSSAFQASGVARAWSFGTSEARILTRLADILEDVERQIFSLALSYLEGDGKQRFEGEIQYPDEFDLSATQTLLDEAQQIVATINSPTLLRTLHKRIAASKVGDTTAKVLRVIQKEIEDNDVIGSPQEQPPSSFEGVGLPEELIAAAEVEAEVEAEEEPEEEQERQAAARPPAKRRRRRRPRKKEEAA